MRLLSVARPTSPQQKRARDRAQLGRIPQPILLTVKAHQGSKNTRILHHLPCIYRTLFSMPVTWHRSSGSNQTRLLIVSMHKCMHMCSVVS